MLKYFRTKISETENMMVAAEPIRLSGKPRVHNMFVTIEGVSH